MLLRFFTAGNAVYNVTYIPHPPETATKPHWRTSADGEIKIKFLAVRQSGRVAGFFDLHKYSLHELALRTRTVRTAQNNITCATAVASAALIDHRVGKKNNQIDNEKLCTSRFEVVSTDFMVQRLASRVYTYNVVPDTARPAAARTIASDHDWQLQRVFDRRLYNILLLQ